MIIIRPETPSDARAVRAVHERAFAQAAEADIVDAIRAACPDALSLVAVAGDRLVGHILFSPAVIQSAGRPVRGMGLAPMAVLPEHQREGIGSRLVQNGLDRLRRQACPFVVVLGHPAYYPRLGFVPAVRHNLACQWKGVPENAFMVKILDEDLMSGVSGTATYRDEFDAAMQLDRIAPPAVSGETLKHDLQ